MGKIMAFDGGPFNEDTYLADKVCEIAARLQIKAAIETGSFQGRTTRFLGKIFDRVVSFEIDATFAREARRYTKDLDNVRIVNGSSIDHLADALARQKGRVFVFLDAHWGKECPLLEELTILGRFRNADPIVMIHDFFNPYHPEYGFDYLRAAPRKRFDLEYVAAALDALFPDGYDYFYNNEATGAKRGVLFAGRGIGAFNPNGRGGTEPPACSVM